jgi:hypothetical protein
VEIGPSVRLVCEAARYRIGPSADHNHPVLAVELGRRPASDWHGSVTRVIDRLRPEAIAAIATHFQVPPGAVPVLVRLEIKPDRQVIGFAATTTGVQGLALTADVDWPIGQLDLVGAATDALPEGSRRPFLHFPDVVALDVYAAQLWTPSGHAMVEVVWPLQKGGSRVQLDGGDWSDDDLTRATSALRWLEALPCPGYQAPSGATDDT